MKLIKTFFTLFIIVLISGCSTGNNKSENVFEKINKKYINMPSYTAYGTLTVIGNKTQNNYDFKQIYKNADKYRMEYDDVVFISANDKVFIYNEKTKSKIDAGNLKSEMYLYFINSFFEKYFISEDNKLPDNSKINSVVLECNVHNSYIAKSKLYLDKKTLLPQLLEYYNNSGECAYKIEIKQFKTEKNINDDLFNI